MSPLLDVRDSSIEGRGLFACEDIPAETVLAVMGGIVMTDEEFRRFTAKAWRYSAAAVGEGLHIVHADDTPLRYGNHSCDPSMWMADEVTIVGRWPIAAGDEAVADYALHTVDPEWRMECSCRSSLCRGVVTGDDWCLPALQERYRGHFSPFINRRIDQLRDDVRR